MKKGQVIAKIDTTFLYQSVKDAEASLDRANAQFADSKRTLDRTTDLHKKGLVSDADYSAALTTYESNLAALKQSQAALDRARINLAYATIYAPINGVVIDRKVNVGQTVAASFSSPTLFTIANDLRRMQVETTVDESDIGRVTAGQEATFTVDAYPDVNFTGRVSQIRLAPQSIQNVVNYIVVVDVQNDQLKLMPGMTANVKIQIGSAHDVMKVSNMACRFQPPSDIIDTTGIGSIRGGMMGRGAERGDAGWMAGNASGAGDSGLAHRRLNGQNWSRGGQTSQRNSFEGSQLRPELFQAIRDSILAAHGGELSQDDMRAEMRKALANRRPGVNAPVPQGTPQPNARKDANKFGIVSNFPAYQKSAYVPSHQSGRGRVWILKPNGLLEPVFVWTGLNDGRYTEITSPKLKSGDQVVLGAASSGDSGTDQARNPLAGQGQRMGGGFR